MKIALGILCFLLAVTCFAGLFRKIEPGAKDVRPAALLGFFLFGIMGLSLIAG